MEIDPREIRSLVRKLTRRTGLPVHDEDLEQDAALKALEALRKRCEIRHPRAFLMKVVRDAVHDYWRRRRPSGESGVLDERRFFHAPSFEDDLDRRRQTELLRQALLGLDSGKRATLELFYGRGLSVAEIARRQNKSPSAVKMELLRLRRSLAAALRARMASGKGAAGAG